MTHLSDKLPRCLRMLQTEYFRKLIGGLTYNLNILYDAEILQFVGDQLLLCFSSA